MTGLTTPELRLAWAGDLCHPPLSGFTFWSGVRVSVNARILAAMASLDAAFKRHGYSPRPAVCGCYNCRQITGGLGPSLHSFAIAVDVNWDTNPYQRPAQYLHQGLACDMPRPEMIDDVTADRTNSGAPVWRWGGDYSGNKDPMHFEVCCSPAAIASGVRDLGHGPPPEPLPPQPDPTRPEEDVISLAYDDKGRYWACWSSGFRSYIEDTKELGEWHYLGAVDLGHNDSWVKKHDIFPGDCARFGFSVASGD